MVDYGARPELSPPYGTTIILLKRESKVPKILDTASTLTKHYFTIIQRKAITVRRNYLNHNRGT
jgi:hypothetical protein